MIFVEKTGIGYKSPSLTPDRQNHFQSERNEDSAPQHLNAALAADDGAGQAFDHALEVDRVRVQRGSVARLAAAARGIGSAAGAPTRGHSMASSPQSRRRHEAAHAIVAEHFGVRVLWLQVSEGVAHTQLGRIPKTVGPVSMGCILLAGSVAEWLWFGTPRGVVSADDLERLQAMGVRGEDFRILWEETERLVKAYRSEIIVLASHPDLKRGKRVRRGQLGAPRIISITIKGKTFLPEPRLGRRRSGGRNV